MRAMPEAAVRRRSWKRQSDTPIAASKRSFTRPNPEIGVVPVVVNKRSDPTKRGRAGRISSTDSESGTSCTRPFFATAAGTVQIARSRLMSDQRMVATSPRRWAVRIKS
jgi:hypothetical protein